MALQVFREKGENGSVDFRITRIDSHAGTGLKDVASIFNDDEMMWHADLALSD